MSPKPLKTVPNKRFPSPSHWKSTSFLEYVSASGLGIQSYSSLVTQIFQTHRRMHIHTHTHTHTHRHFTQEASVEPGFPAFSQVKLVPGVMPRPPIKDTSMNSLGTLLSNSWQFLLEFPNPSEIRIMLNFKEKAIQCLYSFPSVAFGLPFKFINLPEFFPKIFWA